MKILNVTWIKHQSDLFIFASLDEKTCHNKYMLPSVSPRQNTNLPKLHRCLWLHWCVTVKLTSEDKSLHLVFEGLQVFFRRVRTNPLHVLLTSWKREAEKQSTVNLLYLCPGCDVIQIQVQVTKPWGAVSQSQTGHTLWNQKTQERCNEQVTPGKWSAEKPHENCHK